MPELNWKALVLAAAEAEEFVVGVDDFSTLEIREADGG